MGQSLEAQIEEICLQDNPEAFKKLILQQDNNNNVFNITFDQVWNLINIHHEILNF